MKNIIYPFMTMVAAAAALVSCTHKETEVVDKTGYEYRFVIAETDTRATLDNEGVKWEVGDQVGVFLGEELISANAPVNAEDTPKTITVTSTTEVSQVYAYYPYNAANEAGAASAKVVFPASQTGGSVSAMPMAGIPTDVVIGGEGSANGVIHFVNLGSIIDFRVYSTNADYANETVESITFNAPGMAVSGGATLNLTQVSYIENTINVPNLTMAGGDGSSSATVTQSVAVAASKAAATTPIYLVVAPGTYTGTIVVNTNAASYTFTYTEKALSRNKIKQFSMNLGSSNVEREAMTKTYTLVSSALSEDTYILVSDDSNYNGRKTVALFPTVVTTSWEGTSPVSNGQRFNEKDVTLNGDSITTDDPDIVGAEIELVASGSGWKIKAKATGEYLVAPTESYRLPVSTDATDAAVFTISTAQNRSITVGGYYFFHSGSATGFTIRNTGNTVSNVRFYTLSGSSKSQTLWFERPEGTVLASDAVLEHDLASTEPFVAPVLKGVKTSVTYSSDKTQIATVDGDGKVTFNTNHKIGTVTITAHAAADNGYAAAEASYVIHVTDANLPTTTYYKASALETPAATVENPYTYMIVSASGSKYYALQNNEGDLDATEVTVASNQIVMPEDETLLWTAKAVSGNNYGTHSLRNGETYLTRNSSNLQGGTGSTGNYVVWRYDGEDLWNGNSTNYFVYYDSGWKLASGNAGSANAALYTSRAPRTVTFTPAAAEYDIAHPEDFEAPTLDGADGATVTYKSSDENVATVASDGTLTVLKKTSTPITITATIAPTADYQGTTASYTLTVINSEDHPVTYYKADEMEAGKDYLIVSNGYALRNNNGSVAAVQAGSGDSFQYAAEATDLWKATADGSAFRLTNNDKYLFLTSSSSWSGTTYSLSIGNPSNTAANNQWAYNSVEESLKVSSRYVYVNNSAFTTSSTFGDTKKAALYTTTPPLPTWTISFNVQTATYDKYTSNWTTTQPALTTNATTVTYASSNEWVATVSSTGAITALKAGTTTITATAAADATHSKAEASYTLTVVNSDSTTPTYSFISSIDALESGASYLIVSAYSETGSGNNKTRVDTYLHKYIFAGYGDNDGTAVAINPAVENGIITGDYNDYEFVITKKDDNNNYSFLGKNGYLYWVTHSNVTDERYIGMSSSDNTLRLDPDHTSASSFDPKGFDYSGVFFFGAEKNGSLSEFLYYNSDDKYKIGGTGSRSGVYLYKKN